MFFKEKILHAFLMFQNNVKSQNGLLNNYSQLQAKTVAYFEVPNRST